MASLTASIPNNAVLDITLFADIPSFSFSCSFEYLISPTGNLLLVISISGQRDIPLCPEYNCDKFSSTPMPSEETIPKPLTTMLIIIFYFLFFSMYSASVRTE